MSLAQHATSEKWHGSASGAGGGHASSASAPLRIQLPFFVQAFALGLGRLHLGIVPPVGLRQELLLQGGHERVELLLMGWAAGKPVWRWDDIVAHYGRDAVPDKPLLRLKELVHLLGGRGVDEDQEPLQLHPRIDS